MARDASQGVKRVAGLVGATAAGEIPDPPPGSRLRGTPTSDTLRDEGAAAEPSRASRPSQGSLRQITCLLDTTYSAWEAPLPGRRSRKASTRIFAPPSAVKPDSGKGSDASGRCGEAATGSQSRDAPRSDRKRPVPDAAESASESSAIHPSTSARSAKRCESSASATTTKRRKFVGEKEAPLAKKPKPDGQVQAGAAHDSKGGKRSRARSSAQAVPSALAWMTTASASPSKAAKRHAKASAPAGSRKPADATHDLARETVAAPNRGAPSARKYTRPVPPPPPPPPPAVTESSLAVGPTSLNIADGVVQDDVPERPQMRPKRQRRPPRRMDEEDASDASGSQRAQAVRPPTSSAAPVASATPSEATVAYADTDLLSGMRFKKVNFGAKKIRSAGVQLVDAGSSAPAAEASIKRSDYPSTAVPAGASRSSGSDSSAESGAASPKASSADPARDSVIETMHYDELLAAIANPAAASPPAPTGASVAAGASNAVAGTVANRLADGVIEGIPMRVTAATSSSTKKPRPKSAVPKPSAAARPKQTKPRARHPALDSTDDWIVPERDVTLTRDGRPPIWAEGRQELCEALDYFKSYQGGHYDSQERCLGYLLDGFGTANDVCTENGKVIISHGGGCSEVILSPSSGPDKSEPQRIFRLKASQTRDNLRMRALFNCKDTKTPVVLLAGTQWPFFPRLKELGKRGESDAAVRYAVLGHYLVTHIWAEGETIDGPEAPAASTSAKPAGPEFFVRFKVRFEWVPSQGKSWFDEVIGGVRVDSGGPPESPSSDAASEAASLDSGFADVTTPLSPPGQRESGLAKVHCDRCGRDHPEIYEEGVSCYHEDCPGFFLVDGSMPRPASLTYTPTLLQTTDLHPNSLVPDRLKPKTLQELAGSSSITDYSEKAWRGFGCSACGRLSSRSDWLRLCCTGCGAETSAKGRIALPDDWRRLASGNFRPKRAIEGPKPAFVTPDYRVEEIHRIPGFTGYTVELLEGFDPATGVARAKVHHLWPRTEAGFRSADELFEAYQGEEAGKLFKRNRLTRHGAVGALLCQQFTFNAGEQYKHVVGAKTYPFAPEETEPPVASPSATTYAPACAKAGRDHLSAVVHSLKGSAYDAFPDFNEILSVAYMTGGRMNYHDDGERGLGPFVASVSLGSDAIMSFRPKGPKKRPVGRAASARPSNQPPLSPAPAAAEENGDQNEEEEVEGDVPTLDGIKKGTNKTRVALKLRLKHGDIMLMEGEDMQRQFEHKVEPEGLRFAATARYIGPAHFQPPSKAASGITASRSGTPSRFAYQERQVNEPTPPRYRLQLAALSAKLANGTIKLPPLPPTSKGDPAESEQPESAQPKEDARASRESSPASLQRVLDEKSGTPAPFLPSDLGRAPAAPVFSDRAGPSTLAQPPKVETTPQTAEAPRPGPSPTGNERLSADAPSAKPPVSTGAPSAQLVPPTAAPPVRRAPLRKLTPPPPPPPLHSLSPAPPPPKPSTPATTSSAAAAAPAVVAESRLTPRPGRPQSLLHQALLSALTQLGPGTRPIARGVVPTPIAPRDPSSNRS